MKVILPLRSVIPTLYWLLVNYKVQNKTNNFISELRYSNNFKKVAQITLFTNYVRDTPLHLLTFWVTSHNINQHLIIPENVIFTQSITLVLDDSDVSPCGLLIYQYYWVNNHTSLLSKQQVLLDFSISNLSWTAHKGMTVKNAARLKMAGSD